MGLFSLRYCLGLHAFRRLPWWIFGGLVEEHRERFYPCLLAGFGRSKGAGVCWAEPRLPQRRFLGALLKAQLKDLAVSDAAAEVFGADATNSADLRNSAAVEA